MLAASFTLLLSGCGSGVTSNVTSSPTSDTPTTSPDASPAQPDPRPAGYFDGETLTILILTEPGGSMDATARFWAEWLPRYLEGEQTVLPVNMPGGGQMLANNHYEHQVERDGLTLIMGGATAHNAWLFGLAGVSYDYAGWQVLAGAPGGNIWYANPELSGIDGIDNLVTGDHGELFFAGGSPSGADLMKVWAFHVLDVDVQTTWGYDGRGAGRIAFEQGEANIDTQASAVYESQVLPLIESGLALPLFSMGQIVDGRLERDPTWPDLPHFGEIYEAKFGEEPSGDMWDAYMVQAAIQQSLGRTIYVHGDAPEQARQELSDAFERMAADPEYIEASVEAVGPYAINAGQPLRDLAREFLVEVDPAVLDFIADFVLERYGEDLRGG